MVKTVSVIDYLQEMEIGLYLRLAWTDYRLRTFTDRALDVPIPLIPQIWRPDIFIPNQVSKSAPEELQLMKISKYGRMWYVRR